MNHYFWQTLNGIGIGVIIIAVILLFIIVALICAIFEINSNIKEIKKILETNFNSNNTGE